MQTPKCVIQKQVEYSDSSNERTIKGNAKTPQKYNIETSPRKEDFEQTLRLYQNLKENPDDFLKAKDQLKLHNISPKYFKKIQVLKPQFDHRKSPGYQDLNEVVNIQTHNSLVSSCKPKKSLNLNQNYTTQNMAKSNMITHSSKSKVIGLERALQITEESQMTSSYGKVSALTNQKFLAEKIAKLSQNIKQKADDFFDPKASELSHQTN